MYERVSGESFSKIILTNQFEKLSKVTRWQQAFCLEYNKLKDKKSFVYQRIGLKLHRLVLFGYFRLWDNFLRLSYI